MIVGTYSRFVGKRTGSARFENLCIISMNFLRSFFPWYMLKIDVFYKIYQEKERIGCLGKNGYIRSREL